MKLPLKICICLLLILARTQGKIRLLQKALKHQHTTTSLLAAQPSPASYVITVGTPISANGSDINGHCSDVITDVYTTCSDPPSSVLFDGDVPTPAQLNDNNWASQMLILQSDVRFMQIALNFTGRLDCDNVESLEVVMFNCPERQTGTGILRLFESPSVSELVRPDTDHINPNISCTRLLRPTLMRMSPTQPVLTIEFTPLPGSIFVHIAEVVVHGRADSTCPDTSLPAETQASTTGECHYQLPYKTYIWREFSLAVA